MHHLQPLLPPSLPPSVSPLADLTRCRHRHPRGDATLFMLLELPLCRRQLIPAARSDALRLHVGLLTPRCRRQVGGRRCTSLQTAALIDVDVGGAIPQQRQSGRSSARRSEPYRRRELARVFVSHRRQARVLIDSKIITDSKEDRIANA